MRHRALNRWGPSRFRKTTFGRLTRSALMARICSSGNASTELRLIHLLKGAGLKGWRRSIKLFGKPDFVWPRSKIALFVDGCFWHGHGCGRALIPAVNAKRWSSKIAGNQHRDRLVNRQLRKRGWIVIRIWECVLRKHPTRCIDRVRRQLCLYRPSSVSQRTERRLVFTERRRE